MRLCLLFLTPPLLAIAGCRATRGSSGVENPKPFQGVPISIQLPGRAFHAITSADNKWIFVVMHQAPDGKGGGLAVLRWSGERATLERILPPPPPPQGFSVGGLSGLALTHDGQVLVLATRDRLRFYDVAALISGRAEPVLGDLTPTGPRPGYFHIAITVDDRLLFVTNHNEDFISVIDLTAARRASFRTIPLLGRIPVGYGASAVVLSPDNRYLYATSQSVTERVGWLNTCAPTNQPNAAPDHPQGAVYVIDVARAAKDPERSVLTVTRAGCDPVRLALSPNGDRAYIAVRSDSALLVFDGRRLVRDSAGALIGQVRTHAGPVGVVVFDRGRRVAVANALRFTGVKGDDETVAVLSTSLIGSGKTPVLGAVKAGGGHVDLELSADGRYVLVPNYEGQALTLLPISALPDR
jgi:DNA-binding beta-propeller fold protein YncE